MKKIKALLEKAGVNPEVAGKICESMDTFKNSLREQYEREYAAKVEQAKNVCIEETEAHKRELARRVQIFCETKSAAIEAQLAKQSALNESAAVTKLNNIAGLLQGFEPNSKPIGQVTAVVEKLKKKAQVATEERKKAVALANRKTAIAERALAKNRELTAKVNILEQRASDGRQTVTESRRTNGSSDRRIDQSRGGGRPRSTRATLIESQDRQPPVSSRGPQITNAGSRNAYSIDTIAESIDEL
jgi:hypothetical protein